MPHRSRLAAALAGAVALLATIAIPTSSASAEQSAVVPVLRLEGRGHGHGVGMSQWGAHAMARDGASNADIIATFYPGTQLATSGGEVVVVIDRRDHVRVRFPGGGEVRSARSGAQAAGFPVRVPSGGTVDIVREPGGYRVSTGQVAGLGDGSAVRYSASSPQDCVLVVCSPDDNDDSGDSDSGGSTTTTTTPGSGGDGDTPTAPSPGPTPAPAPQPTPQPSPQPSQPAPTTTAPPSSSSQAPLSPTPVWAVPTDGSLLTSLDRARTYRGLFEVAGPAGAMQVRNHLDIESYLKGMAEVPGTWPAAAVQAQAIAARTYALRAMATSGELCDSESCQVYAGTAHESAGQVAAVNATRGTVVTYAGRLAATFYSASAGGFSANVAEGFGSASEVPYLQARPHPDDRDDSWTVDVALTDVADRLGYAGTISAVRVDRVGPSGRPLQMSLDGDAGVMDIDPQVLRRRLGLRSTLFTIASVEAAEAPAPPPLVEDPGVVGDIGDVRQFADLDIDVEIGVTPPRVDPLTSGRSIAIQVPEPSGVGAVGLTAVALALASLAGLVTIARLASLAPACTADGVRSRFFGAPTIGLPGPSSIRGGTALAARGFAATMAGWRNRRH